MTTPSSDRPQRPPAFVLFAVLLLVAASAWWLLRTNTSPAVRECLQLYAEALTATDSVAVDSTVTVSAQRESEPRSCGSMRTASRWQ